MVVKDRICDRLARGGGKSDCRATKIIAAGESAETISSHFEITRSGACSRHRGKA
jgi:hypothetical protein